MGKINNLLKWIGERFQAEGDYVIKRYSNGTWYITEYKSGYVSMFTQLNTLLGTTQNVKNWEYSALTLKLPMTIIFRGGHASGFRGTGVGIVSVRWPGTGNINRLTLETYSNNAETQFSGHVTIYGIKA